MRLARVVWRFMSTRANYQGWNVNDDGVAYHPGMYTAIERHASAVSPWTQSLLEVEGGRRGILAAQAWDRRGPLRRMEVIGVVRRTEVPLFRAKRVNLSAPHDFMSVRSRT